MTVRRLNHAVLYVSDLDASVDFYTAVFGFEIAMAIPGRAAFLRVCARVRRAQERATARPAPPPTSTEVAS